MAKILLDTDIGSDIDDAVCLAYLLAQRDCELLGITTVTGEAVQRAKLASALCIRAGKDIPIFPGTEKPLLIAQRQPIAQQAEALKKWEHLQDFPERLAVDFLRETIRSHPGEITLLAIGPLTNVALLFSVDPETPSMLKSLYTMCGAFSNDNPEFVLLEWNAICDPHAAAIVFNTPVPRHCSIGLDVTQRVVMGATEVREHFQSGLLQPVLDYSEVWFRDEEQITFHDPLAGAVIFDEGMCEFERGTVSLDLMSERCMGLTSWTADGAAGRHEVPFEVDESRFFEHFFSVFRE
jgi:inosine-uridine nucleoside N-ribohydrolase